VSRKVRVIEYLTSCPFPTPLHSQQDGNIKEDFSALTGTGHVTRERLPIFHFKKSSMPSFAFEGVNAAV